MMQSVKYVAARTISSPYELSLLVDEDPGKMSTSLYKFNGEVVYEYFETPTVPFSLSYPAVVSGLAELMAELYDRLLHEDGYW